jgi:hypothetical protein
MTAQLTSTLTPSLLNEFKWGRRVTTLYWDPAYHSSQHAEDALNFMTKINGIPIHQSPVLFPSHMINITGGVNGDLGNTSPLSTFTDTLSWTKGQSCIQGWRRVPVCLDDGLVGRRTHAHR